MLRRNGAEEMTDIRTVSGVTQPYYVINREERNLCAILYHLLLLPGNLARFGDLVGRPIRDEGAAEVYFEYAYLRDIWDRLAEGAKKELLLSQLDLSQSSLGQLAACDVEGFNAHFKLSRASGRYIESPGNWNVGQIDRSFPDDGEFLRICKFKWAFNAKPDLVIHCSPGEAICAECKLESGEGSYPAISSEQGIFQRRGLPSVRQTEIQRLIMEMLGFDAAHILIQKNEAAGLGGIFSWREVFMALDASQASGFARAWLARNETYRSAADAGAAGRASAIVAPDARVKGVEGVRRLGAEGFIGYAGGFAQLAQDRQKDFQRVYYERPYKWKKTLAANDDRRNWLPIRDFLAFFGAGRPAD